MAYSRLRGWKNYFLICGILLAYTFINVKGDTNEQSRKRVRKNKVNGTNIENSNRNSGSFGDRVRRRVKCRIICRRQCFEEK